MAEPKYLVLDEKTTRDGVFRICRWGVVENESVVSCSMEIVYSEINQEMNEPAIKWSLMLAKDKAHVSLTADLTVTSPGLGLGTFMRDRVIEKARMKFAGYNLKPGKLSVSDDGEANLARRNRFYEKAGFELRFFDDDKRMGTIHADDIALLQVSRPIEDYETYTEGGLLGDYIERSLKKDRLIQCRNNKIESQAYELRRLEEENRKSQRLIKIVFFCTSAAVALLIWALM